MPSRYFNRFKDQHITAPKGPAPGQRGDAGAEAAGGTIKEKTTTYPDVGPHWGSSFNRTTRVPVVKTRAQKKGLD